MSKLPYFKFYPQDFVVGTTFMSPQEVGGYIRLLCIEWENGFIPNHTPTLQRLTGCDGDAIETIIDKFSLIDGKLYNDRLEHERGDLSKRSQVNSDNAKLRWERNANAMQSHSERICETVCETVCENDAYQKSEVRSQNTEVKNHKSEVIKENTFADKSADCEEIKNIWNDFAKRNGLGEILKLTDKRKRSILARSNEKEFNFSLILEMITASGFLLGDNKSGWKIDFDFLFCSKENYLKVLEGKYSKGEQNDKRIGGIRISEINDLIANAPE